MPAPRVIVASDKFKGTLTSAEVAAAVDAGVRRVRPDATVVAIPVADGGDGTLAAAVAAGFQLVPVTASGPTGEPVHTAYARRRASADRGAPRGFGRSGGRDDVAVVELADVSGLVRLPAGRPAPMTATSYGTGQLIAAAIDAGCRKVILGIGGSASTDGGAGLVHALTGTESLDLPALRQRLRGVEIVVACDVDNPLTGPKGAAAVYGPQKGATPEQIADLDSALSRWADLVARETGRDLRDAPGAGAAGGVGFAALALLDADLRPGIELVLDLVGFHEQLVGADLVITGEGALDEQTLHGKAVAGIAAAAARVPGSVGAPGTPVVAVCGVNRLDHEQLRAAGVVAAYALTDLEPDVRRCIAEPVPLLERVGEWIAREHLR
ncbi:glycerate kinase [Kribbella sp. NBC_01484]|uniref:glycerate kinase n=1 Tax=Kribbella sp. NBC_01484 TaxID=2903579 RepID=UPI002E381820|nr:glycerate kinase [Kribbella sp. NBC_01484]